MGPLTALLYQVPFRDLLHGYGHLLLSDRFLSLTALVVFVTVIGHLLQNLGYLDRLAASCRRLPGGSRTAVVTLPPLVGLMPMPGGSLLSAPLVNSVLADPRYTPHFKCAINYWFRHVVEFAWPVYAGLILTEAITGLPISRVALLQLPLTIIMLSIGLIVFARKVPSESRDSTEIRGPLLGIAGSIWPVVAAILLYGVVGLELSLATLAALALLVGVARPPRRILGKAFRAGLSLKLVILVLGVLSFQMALEMSGAVQSIPKAAEIYGLPDELIIFLVCFSIGLLTGMVSAYVGLGYTLLAGMLYQPVIQPGHILLAALSGYLGMMFSPAHLCLVLTNEYFGSSLGRVYRILALPFIVLGVLGFLLYLTPYSDLFL